VIPLIDRLAHAKDRPLLIEVAVRTALRDAIAWRIGGGGAPNAQAFAAAAVACARQELDQIGADSAERSRTLAAVQFAAKRWTASALGRRLMTVPASQFVRLAPARRGSDAIVRDRRRRLHAIRLKLKPGALDAGRAAREIADATCLAAADRLNPLTVHVFSLATGQRWTFERDIYSINRARVA
jgi:hypothetical protein